MGPPETVMVAAQNKMKHVYSLLGTGTERNECKKCHFFSPQSTVQKELYFLFPRSSSQWKENGSICTETSSLSRVRTVVINLGKLRGLFPGLESLWKMSFAGQGVGKLGNFMIMVNRDCAEGG